MTTLALQKSRAIVDQLLEARRRPRDRDQLIVDAIESQQLALESISARLEQHFVGGRNDHPEFDGRY